MDIIIVSIKAKPQLVQSIDQRDTTNIAGSLPYVLPMEDGTREEEEDGNDSCIRAWGSPASLGPSSPANRD